MFSESAELYDAIYGTFKNYVAEASSIAALVRSAHPGAHTILDVGCGTGEHAKCLRMAHGFEVDGLDADPNMLAIARRKVPDARFYQADMSAFDLGRSYDVVMCLFSSIGYLTSAERVTEALRCFARHVERDGVIIVEPWLSPDVIRLGEGSVNHAQAGQTRIERRTRIDVAGRISTITFDYRIEDASGVREVRELHELGLFTSAEMLSCFREAGLSASYDPASLSNRGLYVARRAD